MPLIDKRPLADQINALKGLNEKELLAILILELRRLREQVAELNEHVGRSDDRD